MGVCAVYRECAILKSAHNLVFTGNLTAFFPSPHPAVTFPPVKSEDRTHKLHTESKQHHHISLLCSRSYVSGKDT